MHLLNAEIKSLMGRFDVSQTLLAEWLGLSQPGVSSRLHGKASWKVEELLRVAEGFGLHPAYLLGGSNQIGPNGPEGTPAGTFSADAPLAQLAEQLTLNQRFEVLPFPTPIHAVAA